MLISSIYILYINIIYIKQNQKNKNTDNAPWTTASWSDYFLRYCLIQAKFHWPQDHPTSIDCRTNQHLNQHWLLTPFLF